MLVLLFQRHAETTKTVFVDSLKGSDHVRLFTKAQSPFDSVSLSCLVDADGFRTVQFRFPISEQSQSQSPSRAENRSLAAAVVTAELGRVHCLDPCSGPDLRGIRVNVPRSADPGHPRHRLRRLVTEPCDREPLPYDIVVEPMILVGRSMIPRFGIDAR
jgi:hypothetical protein